MLIFCRKLITTKHNLINLCNILFLNGLSTSGYHQSTKMDCRRLVNVEGFDNRHNDVIFCGDTSRMPSQRIVFFGGDVQDYKEHMEAHRDNKRYSEWNLEDTATLIQQKFPDSHTFVVKPSYMHLKTMSSYQNFVESTMVGNPQHNDNYGAWRHLMFLMENSYKKFSHFCSVESDSCDNIQQVLTFDKNDKIPVRIIGFSKGCVVLNQLVYELIKAKEDKEVNQLVDRVSDMYWLDGGHNGGSNTWIAQEKLLSSLVGTQINVHIHVTPYQIKDEMRIWVGKEEKKFTRALRSLGVTVHRVSHFDDEPRSIDRHFDVLKVFR